MHKDAMLRMATSFDDEKRLEAENTHKCIVCFGETEARIVLCKWQAVSAEIECGIINEKMIARGVCWRKKFKRLSARNGSARYDNQYRPVG